MGKSKRQATISTLYCRSCGSVMFVPRVVGKQKERAHIKDMWCFKCKAERKFVEQRSFDHEAPILVL